MRTDSGASNRDGTEIPFLLPRYHIVHAAMPRPNPLVPFCVSWGTGGHRGGWPPRPPLPGGVEVAVGFFGRYFYGLKCFFKIWFDGAFAGAVEQLETTGALPEPVQPRTVSAEAERGAARLLAVMQREGRLVDFLREDVAGYEDAQIGAAVRSVHAGCRKVLDEFVQLAPVHAGEEGGAVTLEVGFDATAYRLVGNVQGEPPFKGTLAHHGWRAEKIKLPELPESMDAMIVTPAEVEV